VNERAMKKLVRTYQRTARRRRRRRSGAVTGHHRRTRTHAHEPFASFECDCGAIMCVRAPMCVLRYGPTAMFGVYPALPVVQASGGVSTGTDAQPKF